MKAQSIYKALANPVRRDILTWLKKPDEFGGLDSVGACYGVPSGAIVERCGLSQSTVSAHLALLIKAELLIPTRIGPFLLLSRNDAVIQSFAEDALRQL